MDFRERVSRSIWPSKLVLSGYRILPAKWILSFTEEVSPALCVSVGWGRAIFCRKSSPSTAFVNAVFVGGPSVLSKTRKQRSRCQPYPRAEYVLDIRASLFSSGLLDHSLPPQIQIFHSSSSSAIRYPTPTSVKIYLGCAGSSSILRRILAILTRRILLSLSA